MSEMDGLRDCIIKSLNNMIQSGRVEEILNKSLEKMVIGVFEDVFRSYSDFTKAMKEHVEKSLKINLDEINLQEQGKAMVSLVQGAINRMQSEEANKTLLAEINKMFETPPEKTTLEYIIEQYIKDHEDEAVEDRIEYCGLVIKESTYDFVYVGLNQSNKKSSYSSGSYKDTDISDVHDCEIQMHFHKNKETGLYNLKWVSYGGGSKPEKSSMFLPTCYRGTSRLLYQMYCAGTEIEIGSLEAGDYETHYRWWD